MSFLKSMKQFVGWDQQRFAAPAHHQTNNIINDIELVGRRSKRACPTLRRSDGGIEAWHDLLGEQLQAAQPALAIVPIVGHQHQRAEMANSLA